MISMEEAAASIGAGVVYRPRPDAPAEDGDITSTSASFVFVRFVGDRQVKACRPEDLEWP